MASEQSRTQAIMHVVIKAKVVIMAVREAEPQPKPAMPKTDGLMLMQHTLD